MFIKKALLFVSVVISVSSSVQFRPNDKSETSEEDTSIQNNDKTREGGSDGDSKARKYLDDAMKKILDPTIEIIKNHNKAQAFKYQLNMIESDNMTLEEFMNHMDNLSLEVCKTSQEALWAYVTDINDELKKNTMVQIAAEEDEIKKQYWDTLKQKYFLDPLLINNPKMERKIRIIKERGTNVQMPQSKQREEIDSMQRIWSRVSVCAYNTTCGAEDSVRTMSDVINIFKTSNDSKELAYYWKAYRDTTGKRIRPIFKEYVNRMNRVARSENFSDAGQMWRYVFEDQNFVYTIERVWNEVKPMYKLIHDYVRAKLKEMYPDEIKFDSGNTPAHLLGNLWAQEWQALYPRIIPYPEYIRTKIAINETIKSEELFDAVDVFHQSIGFESAKDSYKDIKESMSTANCLPSSHDMCDGVHYKIKWCGEKVTDVAVGLSRAARLLGHVQYFKHYKHLPPLYRDGPNPAFHDAISDIVAVQLTSPKHMKFLNFTEVNTGPEATINHLLWLALEKFPLMAYAFVLDKWRWDVFANSSMENWNEHWWNLRTKETGISPPVPRDETDLDPAAKYHVVSHVQYITYLVSHILEFQILLSLCKQVNHTGPLHECSLYGYTEAGKLLSDGMALGASEDWRTVLKAMTGQTELSTEGILEYFSSLRHFLEEKNAELAVVDMDKTAPIIIGAIVAVLTLLIVLLYCIKKYELGGAVLAFCGLSKIGSLDIVANELPHAKVSEVSGIIEEKV